MLTISYEPEGTPLSDWEVEDWVGTVIRHQGEDLIIPVSNELALTALRCAIVEGRLDHQGIQFKWAGFPLQVDKYGHYQGSAPGPFFALDYTERLLQTSTRLYRADRIRQQKEV